MGMKKLESKRMRRIVAESVPGGAFAAGAEVPVASGESIYG